MLEHCLAPVDDVTDVGMVNGRPQMSTMSMLGCWDLCL